MGCFGALVYIRIYEGNVWELITQLAEGREDLAADAAPTGTETGKKYPSYFLKLYNR